MIAVTRSIPVGVDIERIRPNIDMAPLLRRLGETDLPDTTQQLYQMWTRREAKSKGRRRSSLRQAPAVIYAWST